MRTISLPELEAVVEREPEVAVETRDDPGPMLCGAGPARQTQEVLTLNCGGEYRIDLTDALYGLMEDAAGEAVIILEGRELVISVQRV